ncbi:hypothetical protein E3226_006935 [Legionella geestiana]|uniref:hypothetical protein n=1 Tax=Legionella geestiana TaxID=45065 RepID=UPI001101A586|nr:hypothetical protein [Legionella geestiana]QDQ40156.1 hypothetical protein E3226_006935 [Legionella geestiana]
MPRYNVALIPKNMGGKITSMINCRRECLAGYCLGINSLPHITVSQFYSEPTDIESVWQKICEKVENKTLYFTFNKWSNISFDGKINWLSIIPNETLEVHALFEKIKPIASPIRQDKYDPHLTLFNYIKDALKIESVIDSNDLGFGDEFELVLGESDEIGQLVSVIYNSGHMTSQVSASL